MKVFLDDERETPEGWIRTRTVKDTVDLLCTKEVEELSLDNDLGPFEPEGYKVMDALELLVYSDKTFPIPTLTIHSQNLARSEYMRKAYSSILKMRKQQMDEEAKKLSCDYTFYAHKPQSGGWYDEDHSEEHMFEYEIDENQVIKLLASCLLTNKRLDPGGGGNCPEKGYNVVILKGGKTLPTPDYKRLCGMADIIADQFIAEIEKAEKERKEREARETAQRLEDSQRRQYLALKKKFEPEKE